MHDLTWKRSNYGPHAVIVDKDEYGYHATVWLHCDKGNTSLNPYFEAIVLDSRLNTASDAHVAGRRWLEDNNYA